MIQKEFWSANSEMFSYFEKLERFYDWTLRKSFNIPDLKKNRFRLVNGTKILVHAKEGSKRYSEQIRKISNPMSPPEVTQHQEYRILKHNPGAYMAVIIETVTPEAPFSDSFTVEER